MSSDITLGSLANKPIVVTTRQFIDLIRRALEFLTPVADLLIRLWVAKVFFLSGLTKIQSFATTIQLFQYEYSVPLLSPVVAAYMGTAVELGMPVLLALGLLGRFSAVVLFIFNIIAVLSYPALEEAGLRDHQVWGILLLAIACHGPGKLSLDFLIGKWLRRS